MKSLSNLFEKIDSNMLEAENRNIKNQVVIMDDISGDIEELGTEELNEYILFLESRIKKAKDILRIKKSNYFK